MVSILSAPPPPTVRVYDPQHKHQLEKNKLFGLQQLQRSQLHHSSSSIGSDVSQLVSTPSSSVHNYNHNNNYNSGGGSVSGHNNSNSSNSSNSSSHSNSVPSSPMKSSASTSSLNRGAFNELSERPNTSAVDQELLKKILNEDDDDVDLDDNDLDLEDILNDTDNIDDSDLGLPSFDSAVPETGMVVGSTSTSDLAFSSELPIGSPLTIAEEREKQLSSVDTPLPMLWHSKNARKPYNGIVVEPQYYTKISEQLSSPDIRKEMGYPTCFTIAKYICIGTSHGYVLVFNFDQALLSIIGGAICADSGSVTAIDLPSCKVNEDWMVSGHQNGQVFLWDVVSGKPLKLLDSNMHKHPILHLRFFSDGHRFISSDAHGVTNILTVTRGLMSYNIEQQLLLNGNLGPVLSIALLLPGNYPHPSDRSFIVALATKRKILIITASQEGIGVLNNKITKPQYIKSTGVLPYLSWRRVAFQKSLGHTKPLEPILAIGWGKNIQLLQIVTQPMDVKFLNPEFIIVAEYQTDNDICGLEWLDSQTILLHNIKDELRVFDPFALEEVESVNIKSMQLIHHSKLQNVYSFHNTIRTFKAHVYLLGNAGLFSAHILTWLERLSILVSHHQWFEALCLSLDFYEGKAKATTGLSSNTVDSKVITGDKTIEILSQLCSLVFSSEPDMIKDHTLIPKSMFVDSKFMDPTVQRLNVYQQLALIAIEFCVDIKRTDFLFGEVFNYYVEAGMVGTILELLEPYILRDRLTHLNPEVMQYLMSHYQERKVLSRAEQCLLHLDIASLDFHQTVILCRKHGLYSALIYLYNKGLDDYITPLEDMMEVVIKPHQENIDLDDRSKEVAYRLLLYLQYSLTGRSFPRGMIPASRVPTLKLELYEYLFLRNIFPEDPTLYPRLYHLLKFDSTEMFKILSSSFDDEYLATHNRATPLLIPPIPFNVNRSNLNHFNMLSVLLLIVIDRSQEPYNAKDNDRWPFSLQVQGQMYYLVAACIKRKLFTKIEQQLLNRMMGLLAAAPVTQTPMFESVDRQSALLTILQEFPDTKDFDYERLLVLCEGHEFYRVSQYLYGLQANYNKMISCQIKDPETKSQSFDYIRDLLSMTELSDEARQSIKSTTISLLAQLIIIDSTQTAQLIMDHFASDHEKILKELGSFPKLQYTYLVGLLGNDSVSRGTFTQKTGINISNETYELYIKLMCMYSPQTVYKYLSTHDDYPLDSCLKICQQYNNFEGATYLLERTGDVNKALEMILITLKTRIEDLLKHFSTVFANVKNIKNADKPAPQEKEVMDILNSAISLCQRNSAKLQSTENQMIWFKLLDTIVTFVKRTKQSLTSKEALSSRASLSLSGSSVPTTSTTSTTSTSPPQSSSNSSDSLENGNLNKQPKSAVYTKCTTFLNKLVHHILNSMMGYVALPLILTKIVNDHGTDEFGDFKSIITGMLDTCTFETSILNTANALIQRDMFTTTAQYIQKRSKAYSPDSARCLMCNRPLKEFPNQSGVQASPTDLIIIFECRHSIHSTCLGKHTVCPLCSSSNHSGGGHGHGHGHAKDKSKKPAVGGVANSNSRDKSKDDEPGVDPKKQLAQERENDQKATMVYLERLNNFSKMSKRASMYNFDTFKLQQSINAAAFDDDGMEDDMRRPPAGQRSRPKSGRISHQI
ncbi:hypothetical protein SAMD00019534_043410 [Acytostelium subglobosum LB1]|uniref:hypothetical protein n=1 Tax=Acytostelium subglobosum LB1 TaxID=1410327 RepID=UPI0006450216|nr:hypothetical protein SAMD00019534_043410 [Acytostelium subglobosum LB1]GAM21166.1 hypothetical protein SAMD00019534_043410 [Acytostelium subglobosum LB1]|eukprot:XP_012756300.1 hypothetical protein SAMD00019534_043410 [Acytostelium subglobosum LB1]